MTKQRINHEREKIYLIVCPYCEKILNRDEIQHEITINQGKLYTLRASHGICPECLYQHFPQEYLAIQKRNKVRIKNTFRKGYSALKGKISGK